MIHRIQSIYLFLAVLSPTLVFWFFPIFVIDTSIFFWLIDEPAFLGSFIFSGSISLFSLFRYKNRKQQVVYGRVNIIINFVTFSMVLFYLYSELKDEMDIQLGISSFSPILIIIFTVMANKAIMRDEKLIREADRLR